jgi:hypothetical protein
MDGLSNGGRPALRTLDPFTIEECISIKEAAAIAGKSHRRLASSANDSIRETATSA